MNPLFIKTLIFFLFIGFNAIAQNDQAAPPCETVSLTVVDGSLNVSNFNAAHANIDTYFIREDGGWTTISTCEDNCNGLVAIKAEAEKTYLVHVKFFDKDWNMLCEKQITHKVTQEMMNPVEKLTETVPERPTNTQYKPETKLKVNPIQFSITKSKPE